MLQVIIRSSLLRAGTEFTFLLYNWKTISFRIEHFLYSTITKLSSRSDNVMHCSSTGLLLCWLRRNSLQQQQQLNNALCFFCCGERCFAFMAWQLLAVSTKKPHSLVQFLLCGVCLQTINDSQGGFFAGLCRLRTCEAGL